MGHLHMSYVMDVKIPDWSMNGFKFDENECIYIPCIMPAIIHSENTHAHGSGKEDQCWNEIKNTKPKVRSKGGLNASAKEVLETFFNKETMQKERYSFLTRTNRSQGNTDQKMAGKETVLSKEILRE